MQRGVGENRIEFSFEPKVLRVHQCHIQAALLSSGNDEKVKQLRARVASWGIAQFIKEFREATGE